MPDLGVTDVRVFVPAREFAVSRAFYRALGWAELWTDGSLALLELADRRIMLQDHFVRDWAENFMITVEVASADAWHHHVVAVLAGGSYGDARVAEPKHEPWGARVTYVWDPCGVLLHFVEWLSPRS